MNNKILGELITTLYDITRTVQNEEYIKGCKNMYESCKAIIEKHKNEPDWIPCSERLPEGPKDGITDLDDLDEYIVTIDGAKGSTTLRYAGDGEWYDSVTQDFYKVSAWQPMPETYKEKS